MNADSPFEGDVPRDGDEPGYQWLDEWLCEYVDGTMDPSLNAVFEQYVEANPELKAHVQRLKETRDLLCNCGLSEEPPPDVEANVRREVQGDMRQSASSDAHSARGPIVARVGFVSSVTAALVIGVLVGAVVVRPLPPALTSQESSPDPVAVESELGPPSQHNVQPVEWEQPSSLLRPSSISFSAADTTEPPSAITNIGTP